MGSLIDWLILLNQHLLIAQRNVADLLVLMSLIELYLVYNCLNLLIIQLLNLHHYNLLLNILFVCQLLFDHILSCKSLSHILSDFLLLLNYLRFKRKLKIRGHSNFIVLIFLLCYTQIKINVLQKHRLEVINIRNINTADCGNHFICEEKIWVKLVDDQAGGKDKSIRDDTYDEIKLFEYIYLPMDCQWIDYKAIYGFVLSILIINTLVSGKCWFCHPVNHNKHSQSMLFRHVDFCTYLNEVHADWHRWTSWRFKTWNFLIYLCALLITLNCQVL